MWVLIEGRADGDLKYALSNLPAGTSALRAVRLWKSRWPVEQGYQQMKEELGLDQFEGRSWQGVPPPRRDGHPGLRVPAPGAGASTGRTGAGRRSPGPAKKGEPERPLTLPGIRRALQWLLRPVAKPDCVYCRSQQRHPIQV